MIVQFKKPNKGFKKVYSAEQGLDLINKKGELKIELIDLLYDAPISQEVRDEYLNKINEVSDKNISDFLCPDDFIEYVEETILYLTNTKQQLEQVIH